MEEYQRIKETLWIFAHSAYISLVTKKSSVQGCWGCSTTLKIPALKQELFQTIYVYNICCDVFALIVSGLKLI